MENLAVVQNPAADPPRRVTLTIETSAGEITNCLAGLAEAADLFTHGEVAENHQEAASGVALASKLLSRALAESDLSA